MSGPCFRGMGTGGWAAAGERHVLLLNGSIRQRILSSRVHITSPPPNRSVPRAGGGACHLCLAGAQLPSLCPLGATQLEAQGREREPSQAAAAGLGLLCLACCDGSRRQRCIS